MLIHKSHCIAACLERCSELLENSDQRWAYEALALLNMWGLFSLMMRRWWGLKTYIDLGICSMSGFSGNKGCSEGRKGIGMRTIVFQERTLSDTCIYSWLLPSLQANTHAHPRDVRSHPNDAAVQYSWKISAHPHSEYKGLKLRDSDQGQNIPPLLQVPPSPHVHLLSYIPNPRGFEHSGAGLASGAGSAAAAGVTQAPV